MIWIGKWNRSVWLSYVGVAVSCVGMFLAITMHVFNLSYICLVAAGVCDALDGFFARKDKKRTALDKKFGIEIDSLADVVDFIALPIVIVCTMGIKNFYELIPIIFFAICGLARLAYFNVFTARTDGPVKYYCGMPVTFTAAILPLCFLLFSIFVPSIVRELILVVMALIGFLNILNIRVTKLKSKCYTLVIILAIAISIFLGVFL